MPEQLATVAAQVRTAIHPAEAILKRALGAPPPTDGTARASTPLDPLDALARLLRTTAIDLQS